MHIKIVLTAAVASAVWSSTAFAFETSDGAHRSADLPIAFASHQPLMSGDAAAGASSQRSFASALDMAPPNDAPPDVDSTPDAASQAAASPEPLAAQVEVRELRTADVAGRRPCLRGACALPGGARLATRLGNRPRLPIEYPATFTGDFLGIVEQVVVSLQNTDAPIRVKVHEANRVLRVVHATQ